MRYAKLELSPGEAGFHPADRELVETAGIQRVAIHHFNQLDDGTIVFLYQLQGDVDRAQEILERHSDILTHSISGNQAELHAYIHFDPNETVATVFRLPQEHSLVVDTPIDCLPGGGIRVSVLGTQETLTEALEAIPAAVDVELETIREYHPDQRTVFSSLTARQQELLRTAVELGYYDVPRNVTYEDIGNELELSPVTVGEHLRKIEATVMMSVLPREESD